MPRFSRPIPGGVCAHVVTRGNARATVFHSTDDYAQFVGLISAARHRVPIDLLAWCLMPNHVHLVVRPVGDGDLPRFMHWLLTTHVQRHRIRHGTTGRVWQGRYRAFPIQADTHLLTVIRYVERNPVRAVLVDSACEWRWSSVGARLTPEHGSELLSPPPVALPSPWIDWVDTPLTGAELTAVRTSIGRDRPFGDSTWTRKIANQLDLQGTFNPRGRPRSATEKGECPLFRRPL
jgi:putative transposase